MITFRRFLELLGFAVMLVAFWFVVAFWTLNGPNRFRLGIAGIQPWIELVTAPITLALLFALLMPAIIAVVQYAPVAAPHRVRNLALLMVVVPVISVLHSTLMAMTLVGRAEFWTRVWVMIPSAISLYALAALLAHLVIARCAAAERERRRAELEETLTRTQTDALRGRLSPAFLFGALGEIIATIRIDRGEAERLLTALSELLRGVMELDHEQTIPLADELALIDHYVELQPEPMALVVDADEPARRAPVPPFVLQTFVAMMIPEGTEALTIRARLNGGLQLTVSTDVRAGSCEAAPRLASQLERLFGGRYRTRVHHDGIRLVGEMHL